jgi:hypothetical protein
MDQQIKKQWVVALRSGKYKQGREYLRTKLSDGSYSYCCLGVLCDIKDDYIWKNYDYGYIESPGFNTLEWEKLEYSTAQKLADMNDNGASFGEIADWIEANL